MLNLFMDFCDQCESTQRGSVGPSSSQLMCLKWNYHWCCFLLLSGQRASWSCHGRPATWGELPSLLPTRHLDRREEGVGRPVIRGKDNQLVWLLTPTCPMLQGANCESNQGWEYGLLIYPTKHTMNKHRGNKLSADSLINGFHDHRIFI